MVTTKKLLTNLDSNLPGCYHIDANYKLVKNGFPLLVFARTDAEHKIHPIAFCLSSHEQETDFNACDASYNAAVKLFENVDILMCYFHVVSNCKKKHFNVFPNSKKKIVKNYLRNLHMSTSGTNMTQNLVDFRDYAVTQRECSGLYYYLKKSWLIGRFRYWQITDHLAKYYSVRQQNFATIPVPDSKAKKYGEIFSIQKYFKRIDKESWKFNDSTSHFILNLKSQKCNCKFYYKKGVCGHLIGLNKLVSKDEFVRKAKRGG
ncbi:unnamed protein product [Brachionus calyciflorus]|uniref:SWIM-type domain-containing protein n=1 Tax=Brachionus calyciflorus TaxID=104777 RepID=A0A814IZD8_9BILA|nr:unnamed protein product [Brachionus calyciflorus]